MGNISEDLASRSDPLQEMISRLAPDVASFEGGLWGTFVSPRNGTRSHPSWRGVG